MAKFQLELFDLQFLRLNGRIQPLMVLTQLETLRKRLKRDQALFGGIHFSGRQLVTETMTGVRFCGTLCRYFLIGLNQQRNLLLHLQREGLPVAVVIGFDPSIQISQTRVDQSAKLDLFLTFGRDITSCLNERAPLIDQMLGRFAVGRFDRMVSKCFHLLIDLLNFHLILVSLSLQHQEFAFGYASLITPSLVKIRDLIKFRQFLFPAHPLGQ